MIDGNRDGRFAGIAVKPVSTRSDLKSFIDLPARLYRGMAGFAVPLAMERRDALDPARAPLFDRAKIQYWMAWQNGRPVGRISAQVDPVTLKAWGDQIGMFGCLDAVDDPKVVSALVGAASAWLKAEGMTRLRGPFGLSINGEVGLLVEGQTEEAMIMSPWHPGYLGAHVEAAGLLPVKDLISYLYKPSSAPASRAGIAARMPKGVSLRALDFRNFERDAEIMRGLFNDCWQNNWGFVPLTAAEFLKLGRQLRPLLYADGAVFVERDREPIAFALLMPNIYDLARGMNGRLLPINWIRFFWRLMRRSFSSARMLLMGVRSDLQFTAFGAALPMLMIEELSRRGRAYNVDRVELGWVLDDNARVKALIQAYGCPQNKRFRLYEGHLGGNN